MRVECENIKGGANPSPPGTAGLRVHDEHATRATAGASRRSRRDRASFVWSRARARALREPRVRRESASGYGYYIIYFALIHSYSHAHTHTVFSLWLVVYGQHSYAVHVGVRRVYVRLSSLSLTRWRVYASASVLCSRRVSMMRGFSDSARE